MIAFSIVCSSHVSLYLFSLLLAGSFGARKKWTGRILGMGIHVWRGNVQRRRKREGYLRVKFLFLRSTSKGGVVVYLHRLTIGLENESKCPKGFSFLVLSPFSL